MASYGNSLFTLMEPFEYFTHCTSKENKTDIVKDGILQKSPPLKSWDEPLAQPGAPPGVWFSITKYNGRLPNKSPYGTERVLKYGLELLFELSSHNGYPRLYIESIKRNKNNTKQYVRLVLIYPEDYNMQHWCDQNLDQELEIWNNKYLTIDHYGTLYTAKVPDTYVLVFIPYPVNISSSCWDQVDLFCTFCSTLGHGAWECPKTRTAPELEKRTFIRQP